MATQYFIAVDEFCASHEIEISFITSLRENGLIEVTTIKETAFIDSVQLPQLEKFVRFYYDLDINLEGIETISHLIKRINGLHDEIGLLRNKLRLYE